MDQKNHILERDGEMCAYEGDKSERERGRKNYEGGKIEAALPSDK